MAWSPQSAFGTGIAGVITAVGLVVAFLGYVHPVRKYVARVAISGTGHGQIIDGVQAPSVGCGISRRGTARNLGSTQQAPKWAWAY